MAEVDVVKHGTRQVHVVRLGTGDVCMCREGVAAGDDGIHGDLLVQGWRGWGHRTWAEPSTGKRWKWGTRQWGVAGFNGRIGRLGRRPENRNSIPRSKGCGIIYRPFALWLTKLTGIS